MAGSASNTKVTQASRAFGMPELWRVAIWGIATAGALTAAAFTATTGTGIDRLVHATGQWQEAIRPTGDKPLRPLDARESRQVLEAVRLLTDERERLLARISTVEQQVESITGSVAHIAKLAEAAGKAAEATAAERTTTALPALSADTPAAQEATASVNVAAAGPVDTAVIQQSSPSAGQSEFGLDIGGGATVEALRALWAKSRQQHTTSLDGLRPIVHLKENRRGGTVELRLLAGPLPSAVAAARICAKLNAAGAACRPAVFDGQRLAAP